MQMQMRVPERLRLLMLLDDWRCYCSPQQTFHWGPPPAPEPDVVAAVEQVVALALVLAIAFVVALAAAAALLVAVAAAPAAVVLALADAVPAVAGKEPVFAG